MIRIPRIRRSPFARATPSLGAALVLLWLTSSTSSGAPLPWSPSLSLDLLLGSESAPIAAAPLDSIAPELVLPVPARPSVDPLATLPFGAEIRAAARHHAVDPLLVASIVEVESNFIPDAVSSKGAVGLMQLMPVHFGSSPAVVEPSANLDLGARYLGELEERFGDLPTALAAYHAGPGAVVRAGGQAPFRSTRAYVARVLATYDRFRDSAGAARIDSDPRVSSTSTTL